jgi:hypothetical protein
LSGFLRLSERVAEAELLEAVADGLDGAADRHAKGKVIYRNRAAPDGPASGHTTLEVLAGEPGSAQAFFRLNRAAERSGSRDEVLYVRTDAHGGQDGRCTGISAPASGPARR